MKNSPALKIIVGMPAFNEGKYIGSIILQARQHADAVVVVDDGSTDHTATVAELAGATMVRHGENKGYGSAIQSLFSSAEKQNADVLVILDADSQHNPDEIPSLVKAVSEGADVVIGSRKMQGNHIPSYRRVGQKVLSTMTHIASRNKMGDTESGFRAYSRKAIASLKLKENGMAISSEIISESAAKGLLITEVPISVTYTGDGSTLNPVVHGVGVLSRILVMISERRPLLFFGFFGTLSIILGLIAGIMVISIVSTQQVLRTGTALLSMLLITAGLSTLFTGVILDILKRRLDGRM
ncbi:glycosyltransferase family 2 protein [Chloroflexota bacterium]